MDTLVLFARLTLAAVFAVAGVAKLLDRSGIGKVLAGFGVPGRLTMPLALGLPLVELALAVALVIRASAWWGGLAALCLLLAFTRRADRTSSPCFDGVHPRTA